MAKGTITIWTHSGVFHADDVFAVAMINIMAASQGYVTKVSRSRQPVKHAMFVLDVGGKYEPDNDWFDHHQKDGVPIRDNGIKYATAGMVWLKYGLHIVDIIAHKHPQLDITLQQKCIIVTDHVSPFIETLDAVDNGQTSLVGATRSHTLSDIIRSFYPIGESTQEQDDEAFARAVTFAEQHLTWVIESAINKVLFSDTVLAAIDATIANSSPVMVLDKAGPFLTEILNNFEKCKDIKVVVYPGKTDGVDTWFIRTMPGSLTDAMKGKCNAPEAWRGVSKELLPELTGVATATFVHATGFLGATITKEDALQLAHNWVANT